MCERPLISASQLAAAGNRVRFRGEIEHIKTGRKMTLVRGGGIYILRLRVAAKKVNRVTITDVPWWFKILQRSGYNPTHVKQNLPRRLRRAKLSSWSRRGNQESFTQTIPWNLASLVRNYRVRQRHTDPKHMGLQKEQCAE